LFMNLMATIWCLLVLSGTIELGLAWKENLYWNLCVDGGVMIRSVVYGIIYFFVFKVVSFTYAFIVSLT